MLARNELDYLPIEVALSLEKRNNCGKITVTSDGITTQPFDTIELLILEQNLQITQRRFNASNCGDKSIPMYQDFFAICSTRLFGRGTTNSLNIDGYCTLGAGIYYRRTKYTINEDEEYFYITSKFDIYTNNVLDQVTNAYSRITEECLMSSESPRYKEEDTEWDTYRNSIQETCSFNT